MLELAGESMGGGEVRVPVDPDRQERNRSRLRVAGLNLPSGAAEQLGDDPGEILVGALGGVGDRLLERLKV